MKGVDTLPKDFDEYMSKIFDIFKRLENEDENIKFEIMS